MWKRERMMVDVISLQQNNGNGNSSSNRDGIDSSINHFVTNNPNNLRQQPLLQNRLCYPFQGIHDEPNNFYAGNAYNQYGHLMNDNKNKRKNSLVSTATHSKETSKRLKSSASPLPPLVSSSQQQVKKANYTFTSKPYDVMDNIMYNY